MKRTFANFWQKPEKEETIESNISPENQSPVDKTMSNLIKMKEATKLLRASAPTVRKYAQWDTTRNIVSVRNWYSIIKKKF